MWPSSQKTTTQQVKIRVCSSHVPEVKPSSPVSAALSWVWLFRTSHVYRYEDLAAINGCDERGEHRADYSRPIARMQAILTNGRRSLRRQTGLNKTKKRLSRKEPLPILVYCCAVS